MNKMLLDQLTNQSCIKQHIAEGGLISPQLYCLINNNHMFFVNEIDNG